MEEKANKTLVDTAADQIVQVILDRHMAVGDRLPNEYELAESLGISRNTLREAIRRLVSRNVLEVRQGAGTFISDKRGVPEDPLGLTFIGHDPKLALDLLDIRLMLEPEICAIVARIATREQISTLQTMADDMTELIQTDRDYSSLDIQMHSYLAECSGNSVLRNLIPIITSSVRVDIAATNDEHRHLTLQHHRQIVDAISRHDPVGARYGMISHLNVNRDYMAYRVTKREEKT